MAVDIDRDLLFPAPVGYSQPAAVPGDIAALAGLDLGELDFVSSWDIVGRGSLFHGAVDCRQSATVP